MVTKPTAGERDKAADRSATFDSLERIEAGLKKVRTGPISGRVANAQAFLGFNKDAALLNTEIEDFGKSIIKALGVHKLVLGKQVLMLSYHQYPTHQI